MLVGKSAQATEAIGRRQVDIAALKEVRYKNEGVRSLRDIRNCIGKEKNRTQGCLHNGRPCGIGVES